MESKRRAERVVTAFLYIGAFLALAGGLVGAIGHAANYRFPYDQLVEAYLYGLIGFAGLGVLAFLAAAIRALNRAGVASETPRPAPSVKRAKVSKDAEIPALFHQVKTYIDLEMWELAYDKAQQVIGRHPESKEAEALSRNINELRWKAEPKFVAQPEGAITREDERKLVEHGLQQMLDHVRTYMELGMWELARQKALAVLKSFPDTAQSDEIVRLLPEIERKYREASGSGVQPAVTPEQKEETTA